MSIEERFIKQTLSSQAKEIDKAKKRVMAQNGFTNLDWFQSRPFVVTGDKLQFSHMQKERFVDMKTREGNRKKYYPVHNKIIMGHFNEIIKLLMYGLTDDVREKLKLEVPNS